ncbi:MAG: SAM-dependent methyltransferase, partial [Chloroflexi bacterium]
FVRAWPIITWLPFQLKRLRALLRDLNAGPVTVKKRGSPLDTTTLAHQLSGNGNRRLVVVLTRLPSGPIAVICDEMIANDHR